MSLLSFALGLAVDKAIRWKCDVDICVTRRSPPSSAERCEPATNCLRIVHTPVSCNTWRASQLQRYCSLPDISWTAHAIKPEEKRASNGNIRPSSPRPVATFALRVLPTAVQTRMPPPLTRRPIHAIGNHDYTLDRCISHMSRLYTRSTRLRQLLLGASVETALVSRRIWLIVAVKLFRVSATSLTRSYTECC